MSKVSKKNKECLCPYCDQPIAQEAPFCKPCNVEFRYCSSCQNLIANTVKVCPRCGQKQ